MEPIKIGPWTLHRSTAGDLWLTKKSTSVIVDEKKLTELLEKFYADHC